MRIISGSFKGKKILLPKNNETRPLKDLAKESIFNIINHSNKFNLTINNANILDIFSGVGSFGLECLSRGADQVVFIENYSEALTILKKNLTNLSSKNNYKIVEQDAYDDRTLSELNYKFNIIFLDPPFKDKNLEKILQNIKKNKVLDENGILIVHRHKNSKDNLPSDFSIIEEKNYGVSKISFLSFLK
tara:strand:+ start:272 stop:838 length:567 start_codon:yes stop_codon:yes gene_type:complete